MHRGIAYPTDLLRMCHLTLTWSRVKACKMYLQADEGEEETPKVSLEDGEAAPEANAAAEKVDKSEAEGQASVKELTAPTTKKKGRAAGTKNNLPKVSFMLSPKTSLLFQLIFCRCPDH